MKWLTQWGINRYKKYYWEAKSTPQKSLKVSFSSQGIAKKAKHTLLIKKAKTCWWTDWIVCKTVIQKPDAKIEFLGKETWIKYGKVMIIGCA